MQTIVTTWWRLYVIRIRFYGSKYFLCAYNANNWKQKVIFPLPSDCKGSILFVKKLIEKGKFKAVIDRKYPLEQIVEAYKYVEKGQKIGNVLITLEHNTRAQVKSLKNTKKKGGDKLWKM
jgi:hypothetical protein